METNVKSRVGQLDAEMGARIAGTRRAAQISQTALGEMVGMDGSAITRLETGQRSLRYGELVIIAEALGTTIDALVRICSGCGGAPPSGFTCNTCGSRCGAA